ncbi:MAG: hypothetical protein U0269_23355 [Polyangiales bacterium]
MRLAGCDGTVRFVRAQRHERFVRVMIESDDGSRTDVFDAERNALLVMDGEWVEAGAALVADHTDSTLARDERSLENLLSVVGQRGACALVAPIAGTIVRIDARTIAVEGDDRARALLPEPRRGLVVREGDRVAAGDALTDAPRRHRSLLLAWGSARVAQHIADELDRCALSHGLVSPRHTALLARALASAGHRRFERALRQGRSVRSTE